MIRNCQALDAPQICEIYNRYVRESVVTFEEVAISESEMAQRIGEVIEHLPWLVWEQDSEIRGYAYAAPWKARSAYRFSVETTVYVLERFARQGIGSQLYLALLDELRLRNVHCAVAGIALPNPASIALHEKLGFSEIGEFREIGRKFGQWVDVGYWQYWL